MANIKPDVDDYVISFAHKMDLAEAVICDIGSRDAREGIFLYNILAAKTLHIFEPNPEAARLCIQTIKNECNNRENVIFNQVAVSDSDGPVDFYPVDLDSSINRDIGVSSMFKINPKYTARRGVINQNHIVVNAVTLNSYFADKEKPDILWIDVEGAEMKVLRGAEDILSGVKLIHIEVSFRPLHIGKPLFWEIDKYLKSCGFKLDKLVEDSRIKGFLYRHRLLPNLPWRKNALYYRCKKE